MKYNAPKSKVGEYEERANHNEPEQPSRGLGEISQHEIEQRALKIARAAGREKIEASDLAEAQQQLLGFASHVEPTSDTPRAKEKK